MLDVSKLHMIALSLFFLLLVPVYAGSAAARPIEAAEPAMAQRGWSYFHPPVLGEKPVLQGVPPEQELSPQEVSPAPETEEVQPASVPVRGSVSLGENSMDTLEPEQIMLIKDYFFYYFESLALGEPQDLSLLFAEDSASQAQAAMHTATFEVLTETRKMQPVDLRLTSCEYQITIGEQRLRENGDLMIYATEENTQEFAGLPGVEAQTLSMGHAFYMRETEEGWKLTKHWQNEDFHLLVSDIFRWGVRDENKETDVEGSWEFARDIVERILNEARRNLVGREEELLAYRGETEDVPSWDHDYDRQAALEYAGQWIGERNPDWPAYDIYGGNCNNFASQVLLAGGIPMDTVGSAQWKWFSETPNSGGGAWGRSASWAGVNEFYQYAQENEGYGLICDLSSSYFDGQPGDLLQFGALGDWKHTVVIAEVVRDEEGNFVDYLIHSNTADRKYYPASAYPYTDHRLIRILGWSE